MTHGSTWTTINFSNGNYSCKVIQAKSNLESNKHDTNAITLRFTAALFKVLVTLESGCQLDLRSGDFSER